MKHGIRNICTVLCLGSLMMACSSGGTRPEAVTTLPGCTPGYDASIPLPFPVRKNSIGMEFIEIPAGTFQMGSFEKEKSRHDEIPKHCVTISRPFYLGKYEVTQEQWVAIMEDNPSLYKNPAYPVANVSWEDVQVFISRLNKKEGTSKYRLPTEAEWEYAARAGTTSMFSFGRKGLVREHACMSHLNKNDGITCPSGEKKPNPWGLYDIHGNVWEWVQDWYDPRYYATSPKIDPRGPATGTLRVLRGGGWSSMLSAVRSANRGNHPPAYRDHRSGFRVAFTAR